MKRVAVIATVHKENGAANSQALANILKRIEPEVAFLETPKEEMEKYFSAGSLEGRAMALLSKYQSIDLVPVDAQVMSEAELPKFHTLFEFIDSCDDEIAQSMHRIILQRVRSEGFDFLNSPDYMEAQSEIEAQDERLVETQGDHTIQSLHTEWKNAQLYRESWMIESIALYCKAERFESAVFLVGAAHMHSLRSQINERSHLFHNVELIYGV